MSDYRNNFDPTKGYVNTRFQFGQKPLSSEFNMMQSILQYQLFQAMDTLFDSGYIYAGCNLLTGSANTLSIASGYIQLDGYAHLFPSTTFDISAVNSSKIDIYAAIKYVTVNSTQDSSLQHPLQPDLPVAEQLKATPYLSITDPSLNTSGLGYISTTYAKVASFDRTTGLLTQVVTNSNKYMNLQNIPGQVQAGQLAAGSIDSDSLNIQVDGLSLKDKFALTTDDQSGSFLANGGSVVYVSNDVTGVGIRLDAFRAYIQGFTVKYDKDNSITLDPTIQTKLRANESKTYSSGTNIYSLTKNPAASITELDADVQVTNENITRGTGSLDSVGNTPLVSIISIAQSGNPSFTPVNGTDYQVSGDQIQWLTSNRPTQGTTYQATYKYRRAFIIPTDVTLGNDKKTLVFTGTVTPVNGSNFQISYNYFLPRVDSIGVDKFGTVNIYKGVPSDNPTAPVLPTGIFELGEITIPAGSQLGTTFLSSNNYAVPSANSIDTSMVIIASKMRDHQRRFDDLQTIAYNQTVDSVANYFATKDPTLAKQGTFADGFYDDRLSDYGQPTQNMIFNSDAQQGEGGRSYFIQPIDALDPNNAPSGIKFTNKNFATLAYTENIALSQTKWSSTLDLQPYASSAATSVLSVPNTNLIAGQVFTINGYNWNYGEDQIQFYINGQLLTGITILTGTAGSAANSVTPTTDRQFSVQFIVPNNLPIGYRIVTATSAVTLNSVDFLVGVQTASTPLPSVDYNTVDTLPVTSTVDRPCGSIMTVPGHRKGGYTRYQFNCDLNQWVVIKKVDPVCQTFSPVVDCFMTGFDVWFTSKDPTAQVYAAIVQTKDGSPDLSAGRLTQTTLPASSINTNGNQTRFTWDNPVYLSSDETYGIYIECATTGYQIQYAKLGQIDKSSYTVGVGGYQEFASATTNAKGPYTSVINTSKRTQDTTYRWTSKSMVFTPTSNTNIYQVIARVYIGNDTVNLTPIAAVDTGNNRLQFAQPHGLAVGDQTQFTSTSSLPSPLIPNTNYYVRPFSTTELYVYNSASDATNNINNIDFTDAGSGVSQLYKAQAARAIWTLKDNTTNTILWSDNRVLRFDFNNTSSTFTGTWVASGYENQYSADAGNIIPAPISLVANHTYQLTVQADQSYDYKYLRDDYQDDGVLNGKVVGFTQGTATYNKITQDSISSGLLFSSSDATYWLGDPYSDLRLRVYIANFSANTNRTIITKPYSTTAATGKLTLQDSITHFTSLLNSVTPAGTTITMDYTLDGGTTWIPHTPVVFKLQEFNNDIDRETWAYFNYGYYSQNRFSNSQIDTQYIPSNPNKEVSLSALTTDIQFRINLSTTSNYLSPLIDMRNWAIRFTKYGLQTIYFSRTLPLNSDAATTGTPAKLYVWAIIPSGVTQSVALTLGGDQSNPSYVTKSSPTSTRVIDSTSNLIEYEYDFTTSDLPTSTFPAGSRKNPKVRITWGTSNRYSQPIVKRVSYSIF